MRPAGLRQDRRGEGDVDGQAAAGPGFRGDGGAVGGGDGPHDGQAEAMAAVAAGGGGFRGEGGAGGGGGGPQDGQAEARAAVAAGGAGPEPLEGLEQAVDL